MDVVFSFICDYAQASGGKVNALGIGFDTIHAASIPTTHRQFFLVAKLRADAVEVGEKTLTVTLIDADGKTVSDPMNGKLDIRVAPGAIETSANFLVGFDNIQFQHYGTYALHVTVDGHSLIRIPITVAPVPSTT